MMGITSLRTSLLYNIITMQRIYNTQIAERCSLENGDKVIKREAVLQAKHWTAMPFMPPTPTATGAGSMKFFFLKNAKKCNNDKCRVN